MSPVPGAGDEALQRALAHVAEALRGLRYGEVRVVVQDGVVVQVERTERVRPRADRGRSDDQ